MDVHSWHPVLPVARCGAHESTMHPVHELGFPKSFVVDAIAFVVVVVKRLAQSLVMMVTVLPDFPYTPFVVEKYVDVPGICAVEYSDGVSPSNAMSAHVCVHCSPETPACGSLEHSRTL